MDEPKNSDGVASEPENNSMRSTSGQSMDFVRPKTSDTAPPLPKTTINVNSPDTPEPKLEDSMSAEAPETTNNTVQSAPETTPVQPVAFDGTDSDSDTNTPVPDPVASNPLAASPQQAAHKSGAPVVAIVVAIIVALCLAGLVVFTFIKSKKDSVGSKNKTANSAAQTAAKPLASPADIDNTSKELDTSLSKTNDAADFAATDLSDKSLGL